MNQKSTNQLDQVTTKRDLLSLEEKFDGKARGYRDDLLNKLDEVMGELETIREEQTLSTGQYRDHEKRITDLEKLQRINQ